MMHDRSPIRRKSAGDVSCLSSLVSFPLLAIAPDPLPSDWMLSWILLFLLLPVVSLSLSAPASRSIRPSSGRHLHPRGPPLSQAAPDVLSSIPVSHRSRSVSGSIPLSCTAPPLGSAPVSATALYGSYSRSFPNLSRAAWSCPYSFILLLSRLPGPQLVGHLSFWYSSTTL